MKWRVMCGTVTRVAFKQDRKSGRTALHMAAEEANIELLRLFLDQPNYCSVINTKVSSGMESQVSLMCCSFSF